MKEIISRLIVPIAIITVIFWFMLWISFALDEQNTKSDANTLRKLGFEVVADGTKCHAKIKDGSWRTCQRVLLVMGG